MTQMMREDDDGHTMPARPENWQDALSGKCMKAFNAMNYIKGASLAGAVVYTSRFIQHGTVDISHSGMASLAIFYMAAASVQGALKTEVETGEKCTVGSLKNFIRQLGF